MTMIDKVNGVVHTAIQSIVDKEPINYIEAGSLYGIVTQGRHNVAVLSVLHNQAKDHELKTLIAAAIDSHSEKTVKVCEDFLEKGHSELPKTRFSIHPLKDNLDIPFEGRLSDEEIAMLLINMAKASQLATFSAILNTYQPEIALSLRRIIDDGLDWNYKLVQLMIHRGWLPTVAKIEH
ncbi:MAG: hypothetical protein H6Q74_983 [Firmicutes bacterium]|nr:hypothetical protein [Bacillota bacterium]